MPRKPSFDTFLAIEMFKTGKSYDEIAEELHIKNSDAVRKTIKRHAAELLDSPLNRYEVISLFKSGSNYQEIADKLKSNQDAVKKIIQRYAPELLENSIDKDIVINLYNNGLKYKDIAKKLGCTESAIKSIVVRSVPEEIKKRRAAKKVDRKVFEPKEEEINLLVKGNLTIKDRKELANEKTWGINTNESISDYSFFKWNSPSYIPSKKNSRKYIFNEKHGSVQEDLKVLYL